VADFSAPAPFSVENKISWWRCVQENLLDVPATKPLITRGGSPEFQGPGTPTTEEEGPRDRGMGANLAGAMEVEGYLPRKSVLGKSSLRPEDSEEGSPRNTMRKSLSRKSVTWGDEAGGELEQVNSHLLVGDSVLQWPFYW
jgi:hypothetical protein